MKITNKEKFLEAREFAASIHDNTLQDCLDRLSRWEYNDPDHPKTIYIGGDFAEHSLSFREVYEDGRTGVCGGIIFHSASADQNNYSVSLSGRNDARWEIHT
ncbi:DUF4120 family protein [Bacteroides sp. 224]|uniref:DUF4120 family protein n=1 Tax=Bacteroides sp. 224 TaxID=2302936 RepID=UPI0013D6BB3D|nr:DUF4120 family protein [Bacteroides sp. 224]NDV63987.1 DUF4120 domain-containing protein [Bacteroides sp. 224]